ncbi:phage P4 alpha zinc-binding domain-containing protein [Salinisphaera shabanensis T35B1]|uniref:DUF7146 domain-containing protein n=1 Tax=Salinisphaera TaxID=180541 RepID=UPI003342CF75
MKQKLDVRHVASVAENNWAEIFKVLAPDLEDAIARPGRHGPCPLHGGTDGFRLFRDVHKTGGGICNQCGPFADGFALIQSLNGWRFRETLEAVAACVGIERSDSRNIPPVRRRRFRENEATHDAAQARRKLRQVWEASVSLHDPSAEPLRRYLSSRGQLQMALSNSKVIRFHPGLPYYDEDHVLLGHFPAMVSLVRDRTGEAGSIHRTYLTQDGQKADVPKAKKLMVPHYGPGTLGGGAIPLNEHHGMLGLAEGIETALSVTLATGIPTWSCVSATMLERFEPPENVHTIIVWADKDLSGAGQKAAASLKLRMWELGKTCCIMSPPGEVPEGSKSIDWNDVLLRKGVSGFPRRRERAA